MASGGGSFKVGIDFGSVHNAISKQIYETPLAFIRENVQNAVDAIRIQALRDGGHPSDPSYRIDVLTEAMGVTIRDNGIGMSQDDLRNFFWTIGASGKRTEEAKRAGCVGMFGIGGFANFGVCQELEVISQIAGSSTGTITALSDEEIRAAGSEIPEVRVESSDAAGPRGTIVVGHLCKAANAESLKNYLKDFVRFVAAGVYFDNELISQKSFQDLEQRESLSPIDADMREWEQGNLKIQGRMYEDRGHTLVAALENIWIDGEPIELRGQLRFENGPIDVFKRGFKLCATQFGTTIGVSGRLDCDRFVPTAGRDSLDGNTTSLIGNLIALMERVAVRVVLQSGDRIAEHTRVFRYVVQQGWVDQLGKAKMRLADGTEISLAAIKRRAEMGGVGIYFGTQQKQALSQIMLARGHLVVLLSSDRHRQKAERAYLERHCQAKAFEGMIECTQVYEDLSRFEKIFLSEVEMNISQSYEVKDYKIIAGKLTEDIPVYLAEKKTSGSLVIYVDVKHPEIAKLESLGIGQLLYSMIATFCREYLGPSLRKWSPKFFGDGALNLEILSKRRSELWILLKDDIGVIRKRGQPQVVTKSDIRTVNVGSSSASAEQDQEGPAKPRILQIVDDEGSTDLAGFYLRLPDTAYGAYGDVVLECDSRAVVWTGNKITYVVSDAISSSFQYEIRLDELVVAEFGDEPRAQGVIELTRPLQEVYDSVYFPVPKALENYMIPQGDMEIRLELHCDLFDTKTARHWEPPEAVSDSPSVR